MHMISVYESLVISFSFFFREAKILIIYDFHF